MDERNAKDVTKLQKHIYQLLLGYFTQAMSQEAFDNTFIGELGDSAFFRTQSYISSNSATLNFYQICLLDDSCLCEAYLFMHINCVSLQCMHVYM